MLTLKCISNKDKNLSQDTIQDLKFLICDEQYGFGVEDRSKGETGVSVE